VNGTFIPKNFTVTSLHFKIKSLEGRYPVRSKITVHYKLLEQAYSFNYLRILISYGKEMDIDKNLDNCLQITHY